MNIAPINKDSENESLDRIAALSVALHQKLEIIRDDKISGANMFWEIGLMWQGIAGHQRLQYSVFERVKDRLQEKLKERGATHAFTFEHAQAAVKIANASPEKFKTLKAATDAIQLAFNCEGFLQIEHRTEPQSSRAIAPSSFVFNTLGSFRQKFEKNFFPEVESWSDDQKRRVARELVLFEEWIAKVKEKLPTEKTEEAIEA